MKEFCIETEVGEERPFSSPVPADLSAALSYAGFFVGDLEGDAC
jgi:hypothetical protein